LKIMAQQKLPFDLVFTTTPCPAKNGWQLIQEVAAAGRWRSSSWPPATSMTRSGGIAKNPAVRILNKPYGIAEPRR